MVSTNNFCAKVENPPLLLIDDANEDEDEPDDED
jgi:hypothetical protein